MKNINFAIFCCCWAKFSICQRETNEENSIPMISKVTTVWKLAHVTLVIPIFSWNCINVHHMLIDSYSKWETKINSTWGNSVSWQRIRSWRDIYSNDKKKFILWSKINNLIKHIVHLFVSPFDPITLFTLLYLFLYHENFEYLPTEWEGLKFLFSRFFINNKRKVISEWKRENVVT